MESFRVSLAVCEDDNIIKELNVELKSLGEDKFQPVIVARDSRNGFRSTTELPVGDYTDLRKKIAKFTKLDAKDAEAAVRKLITLISWAG